MTFTARIFVLPESLTAVCLAGGCTFRFTHTHTQTFWDVADVREALKSHLWTDHAPNPPKLRIDLRFKNGGAIKNGWQSGEAGPALKTTSDNRAL